MEARFECCDENRRNAVATHPSLNGIDALEVIDRDLPVGDPMRQRTLLVHFLKATGIATITREQVLVRGGVRVRDPAVEWVGHAQTTPLELALPENQSTAAVIATLANPQLVLIVRVAAAGDYSRYTFSLDEDASSAVVCDPRMQEVSFSFKAECPSEFDCQPSGSCSPAPLTAPPLDYLARDFATLRRMMLDRIAQLVPGFHEQSVVGQDIALVELLAYLGDHLTYSQDAVATEAYLATARRRVSLRRHAQLVDYAMHDGCNARTFVHLELAPGAASLVVPREGTSFLTRCARSPIALQVGTRPFNDALAEDPLVFEPLGTSTLHEDHNELHFYSWGDGRCCLPQGATRATLRGHHPHLTEGMFLLFEEVLGPKTGLAGDAALENRQVVRLKHVWPRLDPLPNPPVEVTEMEWESDDALERPLWISTISDAEHGARALNDVSVARGNLVLADHGRTLSAETLPRVPEATLFAEARCAPCDDRPRSARPLRYRPRLAQGPITQAARVDESSARRALRESDTGEVLPAIWLRSSLHGDTERWEVQPTLLESFPDDAHFVLEVEDAADARIRFGDDVHGKRPAAFAAFEAHYRVGNGTAGNLGAERLVHVAGADVSAIVRVRNPIAARGGREPEELESVRRRAPQAFREPLRAVTPTDYASMAMRNRGVQRAAARQRWTGSWYTMFVSVDARGGEPLDAAESAQLLRELDDVRMIGHDLAFEPPISVSLELALHVCVEPEYFRADVRRRLSDVLSSSVTSDGTLGQFHPDRFSFGKTVHLSPWIAAAHRVPGVASIEVLAFGRQHDDDPAPREQGLLVLGPREIARLDNDPNFPERGIMRLELHGGK